MYVHICCQDRQNDLGGCWERAFWNQDGAGKLSRLMESVVDQLENSSVEMYIYVVGHMMAEVWDQVAQGTGLLVVEGLVGERLWGNPESTEPLVEAPLLPSVYPRNQHGKNVARGRDTQCMI